MSSATVPQFGPNDWFVEEKYQQFIADPNSVDESWREYFAGLGVTAGTNGSSHDNGGSGSGGTRHPTGAG